MELKAQFENLAFNLDKSATLLFRVNSFDYDKANRFIGEMNKLSNNGLKPLKLTINRDSKQRSINANAYFHLLVNKIAEKQNIGNDDCKVKMNLEYGTIATDSKGNNVVVKLPADVDISQFYEYSKWIGEKVEKGLKLNYYVFYKQTHTLNTTEMARLIDGVVYEAKELGIETKTPNEIREMMNLWEQN